MFHIHIQLYIWITLLCLTLTQDCKSTILNLKKKKKKSRRLWRESVWLHWEKGGRCFLAVWFGFHFPRDITQFYHMSSEAGPGYNKDNDESEQKLLISSKHSLSMFQVYSFNIQRKSYWVIAPARHRHAGIPVGKTEDLKEQSKLPLYSVTAHILSAFLCPCPISVSHAHTPIHHTTYILSNSRVTMYKPSIFRVAIFCIFSASLKISMAWHNKNLLATCYAKCVPRSATSASIPWERTGHAESQPSFTQLHQNLHLAKFSRWFIYKGSLRSMASANIDQVP